MGVALNTRTAPTKRTLAYLSARGWHADIAERRSGPITVDLFGCIDLVAVHPELRQILFVQVTGHNGGNLAARVRKVAESPHTKALLRSGARVEVWAWKAAEAEPRVRRMRLQQPAPVAKEPTR